MASLPLLRPEPLRLRMTIYSLDRVGALVPPRTKKNSAQLIPHMKHPLLVPSEAYRAWHRGAARLTAPAVHQLAADLRARHGFDVLPIAFPVRIAAVFYRDALRGDLVGFLQAISDFLQDPIGRKGQEIQVLADDKWIASYDGSRLDKDSERPRIELEIEEL